MHQGVEMDYLQWTPDSSSVIFRSTVTGISEFHRVGCDGRGSVQLTAGSAGVDPRISPCGGWLAYLSPRSGNREVWLHPLTEEGGADDIQLTDLGGEINSLAWAPSGEAMAVACNRYGSFDVYQVDLGTGEWERLTDGDVHEHFPAYAPDGTRLYYVRLSESWEDHTVVEVELAGGETRSVVQDPGLFDYQIGKRFSYPLPSPDGEAMLFRSHRNNWINYWRADLADPGEPEPLCEEEYDQAGESGTISLGDASWSPDGRFVAYPSNRNGNVELRVVCLATGESEAIAADGEGVVTHPAWSPDGEKIAFTYQDFLSPPDVHIVRVRGEGDELQFGEPERLTNSVPAGLRRKLNRPEKHTFFSFDGLEIPAYIYRPDDAPDEPGPAILEIHGGPVDQFRDTIHHVVQYYVQRGYTVMMCNVRGSAGYGKEFERGISNGWGVDDLKDLVAGARYLVEQGLADPERIGVTGQSYGGFLSMAVACCAPKGVFQAAIGRTGYADWGHYYRHGGKRTVKLMLHSMGRMEDHPERYEKGAPLRHADGATMPLFIVDQDAPPTEPNPGLRADLASALGAANKVIKYESYPSTGGAYARSDAGANQLLPDMIEFFDTYLKR